jgi:hypothetical protein
LKESRADSIRVMHPLFQVGQGGSIPTSALQLRIEESPLQHAAELNKLWHSALPDLFLPTCNRDVVSFVGTFDGRAFATAIWSGPVSNHHNDGITVELRRFAIAPDAPKFTASRMLGIMARLIAKRMPHIRRLISYQATAVHAGTIYKAAGWTAAHLSKNPKWGTRKRRAPRSAAQRAVAVDGLVPTACTRRPPQIQSDKVRWEKQIGGAA